MKCKAKPKNFGPVYDILVVTKFGVLAVWLTPFIYLFIYLFIANFNRKWHVPAFEKLYIKKRTSSRPHAIKGRICGG